MFGNLKIILYLCNVNQEWFTRREGPPDVDGPRSF